MTLEPQYIEDSTELYRRIHKKHIQGKRITSAAFKHTPKEKMFRESVDVAEWTTPEKALSFARNPADNRLGVLITGGVRDLDQSVDHDPQPENPAHALIIGDKSDPIPSILATMCYLLDP